MGSSNSGEATISKRRRPAFPSSPTWLVSGHLDKGLLALVAPCHPGSHVRLPLFLSTLGPVDLLGRVRSSGVQARTFRTRSRSFTGCSSSVTVRRFRGWPMYRAGLATLLQSGDGEEFQPGGSRQQLSKDSIVIGFRQNIPR